MYTYSCEIQVLTHILLSCPQTGGVAAVAAAAAGRASRSAGHIAVNAALAAAEGRQFKPPATSAETKAAASSKGVAKLTP